MISTLFLLLFPNERSSEPNSAHPIERYSEHYRITIANTVADYSEPEERRRAMRACASAR